MNAELMQPLQAALELRYDDGALADIATLEAAIEILQQEPIVCDCKSTGIGTKRAQLAEEAPTACRGIIHQRRCADCGHTITRCEQHGGNKSASREAFVHRTREHQPKERSNA